MLQYFKLESAFFFQFWKTELGTKKHELFYVDRVGVWLSSNVMPSIHDALGLVSGVRHAHKPICSYRIDLLVFSDLKSYWSMNT